MSLDSDLVTQIVALLNDGKSQGQLWRVYKRHIDWRSYDRSQWSGPKHKVRAYGRHGETFLFLISIACIIEYRILHHLCTSPRRRYMHYPESFCAKNSNLRCKTCFDMFLGQLCCRWLQLLYELHSVSEVLLVWKRLHSEVCTLKNYGWCQVASLPL